MKGKNLTRSMKIFVSKKLNLNPDEWVYIRNTNDKFIIVNKLNKEKVIINKLEKGVISF